MASEDGLLAGIVTDGDLRRHMSADLTTQAVVDIMTAGAKTLHPDTLASEAVHFMNENKITNVFVVADRTRRRRAAHPRLLQGRRRLIAPGHKT